MLVKNEWEFVPVGNNLTFEFKFLAKKFNQYLSLDINVEHFVTRPHIDIKPVMILANGGKFKGCHLVLGKKGTGANIPIWYNEKNHEKIIEYIENEADCFLQFLSVAQLTLGNMVDRGNNFV